MVTQRHAPVDMLSSACWWLQQVTNEVLQGIKSIKMFGWEDSFLAQVGKLR